MERPGDPALTDGANTQVKHTMKTITVLLGSVWAAAAFVAAQGAETTQFAMKATVVANGGGTMSGGQFSLSGTIGQHEAAPALSGGQFQLQPGFWCGITLVQQTGAPILTMRLGKGGNAVIGWPANVSGFVLEEASALTGPWTPVTQAIQIQGDEQTVLVPAQDTIKLYRLRKPAQEQ
jgi:hypothetical protein